MCKSKAAIPRDQNREEEWAEKGHIKFCKDKTPEQENRLSPLLSTCQTTTGSCIQFWAHKSGQASTKQGKLRGGHWEGGAGALTLWGGAVGPGLVQLRADVALGHLKAPWCL